MSKSSIPTLKVIVEHKKSTRLVDVVATAAIVFAAGAIFRGVKKLVSVFTEDEKIENPDELYVESPEEFIKYDEDETPVETGEIAKATPIKEGAKGLAKSAIEKALATAPGQRFKNKVKKTSMKLLADQLLKESQKEN